MHKRAMPGPARPPFQRTPRSDAIAWLGIGGAGLLVGVLLAWSHLGVGAWLFPPPATAPHQTTVVGDYHISATMRPNPLTVRGPNDVAFTLTNAAGQPTPPATLTVHSEMVSMGMTAPTVAAVPGADGRYHAAPTFAMAGDWRLVVHLTHTSGKATQTSFIVSVHWS
jgi:hypothetical protein